MNIDADHAVPGGDPRASDVVQFWRDAGPDRWFAKDEAFDRRFCERYAALHEQAATGRLDHWLSDAVSALALILLLDQFPRNVFRGTARMYATDPMARVAAGRAIEAGHDQRIDAPLRLFFYLPYSHSESLADQDRAVALQRPLGEPYIHHCERHRDIVRRFGRFPHRNSILGRASTSEEQVFLDEGGFSG